jgi:hypothetical protein
MKRILAMLMTVGFALAACNGGGPQSVSSPTATAQASTGVSDNPTPYAIGGMIQSIEKPSRGLAGARIEITQGVNAGKSAVSDDSGSFAIFNLASGSAILRVSKDGYLPLSSKVFDLQADTKFAIELFPTPPTSGSGASATGRCNDGGWTWSSSRTDACANNGGLAYGVCPGPLCKSGI